MLLIDLLQKPDLVVFLNDAYTNANDFGSFLSSTRIYLQKVLIFTGLLNTFLLYDFLSIVWYNSITHLHREYLLEHWRRW